MRSWLYAAFGFFFGVVSVGAAPLQVSALHPLMADLARQVGGGRVEVFDLVGEGGNPHRFEPRPADMKRMQESAIVLASGKHLEPYLGRVKAALPGVMVVEVGETIPSIHAVAEEHDHHEDHDHDCAAGGVDPHWWHGIDNMRRAARVVARAFGEKDPGGRDDFMKRSDEYGRRLDALKRWAGGELAKIPQAERKLVTSHNAFAYFAREFGFQVVAVAGLNKEQNTAPREQAAIIAAVKAAGTRAVFPEKNTSTKALAAVALAAGTRVAEPLIADGNGSGDEAGFEGMIRHNVNAITRALTTP